MLELTAPRVHALNAYMYRKLELDEDLLVRSSDQIVKALRGGKELTRDELAGVLQQLGIARDVPLRFGYVLHYAELEGLICSGGRKGKQFTYALLDERAPQAKRLSRDEALAELVKRFFMSHGPATLKDFAWWSGLTAADARAGVEMVKHELAHEDIDGVTYWFTDVDLPPNAPSPTAHLLPNYDEYGIAYKDHRSLMMRMNAKDVNFVDNMVFPHMLVMDGQAAGTWKRTLKKDSVLVEVHTLIALNEAENDALIAAVERYGTFLGMRAEYRG